MTPGQPFKLCPKCQTQWPLGMPICQRCGHKFSTVYAQQPTQAFYAQPQSDGSGMAIASMVCGIVGLVGFFLALIAIPCAIVGIVLGQRSLHTRYRGMAIAGITCGSISLGLMLILWTSIYLDEKAARNRQASYDLTERSRASYETFPTVEPTPPKIKQAPVYQPKPSVIWNDPRTEVKDYSGVPQQQVAPLYQPGVNGRMTGGFGGAGPNSPVSGRGG